MKRIGEMAPTLIADRQARRGLAAPWANGKNGKEFRATMGRKPIVGIFSVGLEEPYRWKDSVQNDAEFRLWAADGVANDLRPWFTKFSGVLHDERWLKPVEEMFRRYASWEKYLRNERSLARVAIVYSQQTAWFHGTKVEDHTNGWYQALIEARIPFEMVHDRLLDELHVDRFKTLILPNIAALSEQQCDQLRAFVQRGGSVIATHETSLYDEWGVKRQNFGLADLLGVDYAGQTEVRMQNAYLRLEHDAARHHPLLRGLENAPRIVMPHRAEVIIYRTSAMENGEPTHPTPWFQNSYPWGTGNHHAVGCIGFGPDGHLYATSGSRTDGNDPALDDPKISHEGETPLTACIGRPPALPTQTPTVKRSVLPMHQLSRISLLVPVFTAAWPRVTSGLSRPKLAARAAGSARMCETSQAASGLKTWRAAGGSQKIWYSAAALALPGSCHAPPTQTRRCTKFGSSGSRSMARASTVIGPNTTTAISFGCWRIKSVRSLSLGCGWCSRAQGKVTAPRPLGPCSFLASISYSIGGASPMRGHRRGSICSIMI
jgi:hypothetical protein